MHCLFLSMICFFGWKAIPLILILKVTGSFKVSIFTMLEVDNNDVVKVGGSDDNQSSHYKIQLDHLRY